MNRASLAIFLGVLSFNSYAEDTYVIKIPYEVKLGEWSYETKFSEWSNAGEAYNCTDWTPYVETIDYGVKFQQEQSCSYDGDRLKSIYKINSITGESVLESETIIYGTYESIAYRENEGTHLARNMCIDILNKGKSTGNGEYLVDPDGDGPLPSKMAYCDMSNGGWTLYDGFGTKLALTDSATPSAYNRRTINSAGDLVAAGYTYLLDKINNSHFARPAYYMQFYYNGGTQGYIKTTLPSWVNGVRVSLTNQWYHTENYVILDGVKKTIPGNATWQYMHFDGTGELVLKETGVYWAESVWVK